MSLETLNEENEKNDEINEEIHGPMDYTLKHPLQNMWSLWFYENDRTRDWSLNLKEIISFDTVEDFWRLYNHIKPPSELKQGNDYSLFKKGIKPMWEDPVNKRGGRWLINVEKKHRSTELDRYWLDVLLCLIGEAFDNSDEICGAVVNVRQKMDKIAVWTVDPSNTQAVMEIGRKIKDMLHIPPRIPLTYQLHVDQQSKNSSTTKHLHTI